MPVEMNAREKENRKKAIEHLNAIEKHKEALRNLTGLRFSVLCPIGIPLLTRDISVNHDGSGSVP